MAVKCRASWHVDRYANDCTAQPIDTTELYHHCVHKVAHERFLHSLTSRERHTLMTHIRSGRDAMFYAKWLAQVLLIMVLIGLVVLLAPPLGVAAVLLLVAPLWSIWLLASLALQLMRKPAGPAPNDEPSPRAESNAAYLTAASRIHRARVGLAIRR
ncbi:MAG: hypothetical protein JWN13_2394 [Betaproteobacteria bacterium]|jgi:hypothetical protein|nr:hypothetical protein [Betaproteobacteria bacterium]